MTFRPCIECGTPTPGTYCAEHAPVQTVSRPSRAAGYDGAWDRLSKRARKLSPFCEDCGTPDDLTCDHSAEAWRRKEAGKPIRLCDVAVVCRSCNARRGAARGELTPGGAPLPGGGLEPRGEAKFRTLTGPKTPGGGR